MRPIKAIIADDEEQLRIYLKTRLTLLWPELEICAEAANGPEALDIFDQHQPDIAFLDIRMPGFSGIKVAEKIAGKCWVVFISAYDHYALKAFENEAIDYIIKPVTDERLTKTIKRLQKQIAATTSPPSDLRKIIETVLTKIENRKDMDYLNWIKAPYGDEVRLIPVKDVYYFKAGDKYTIVMTSDGESLIRKSIKTLVEELDPQLFWQIHRGTIVNVNQIANVTRSFSGNLMIRLKNHPETLSVSRAYSHLFKQM
ncbi:MAG: response regulator transcription factor [Deltaproteobacteria bacterium]|nr:response regulator transcription factor [Deltaproteobacteria bacterium]